MADLGVGVRNLIDEGGFARIRQAEHADIGKQLEPQPHPHFLARNARLVLARSAIGAGLVAGIAAPAHAAFEEDHPLADLGEIGEHLFLVLAQHLRADRDRDDQIGRTGPRAVLAHAMRAARRLEMLGITEVDQRVEAGDRFEDHIPALAAIAAVGAAIFDVFFPPERDRAGPACAGADEYLCLI